MYHVPPGLKKSMDAFLEEEWWSCYDHHANIHNMGEIMEDRNMHTKERYRNIFDMRKIKTEFLLDHMP